ncbi:MAG: DUF502 domain-containing protein [Halapricum sp.]
MNWNHWLRNSFITGLLLVAPLAITILTLQFLLGWLTGLVGPLVTATNLAQFTGNIEYLARLLALFALIVLIIVIGFVAQWGVADRIFGGIGRVINFIPMVRVIYASVRQVSNSLVSSGSRYESVVLVEYPRDGVYAIGFVTAESPEPVQTVTGDAVNVYLPNSPNPTNGFLAMVPDEQVHEINMSVRRGIRLMVTTGMAETSEDLEELESEVDVDFDELTGSDEDDEESTER